MSICWTPHAAVQLRATATPASSMFRVPLLEKKSTIRLLICQQVIGISCTTLQLRATAVLGQACRYCQGPLGFAAAFGLPESEAGVRAAQVHDNAISNIRGTECSRWKGLKRVCETLPMHRSP
jgi:hypothetical protein